MIVLVKLLASGAVICLAFGYAARWRDPFNHRRMMGAGIALATLSPAPLWVGGTLGYPSPLMAYWLVELFGTQDGARWSGWLHQGLCAVLVALMWAQAVFGLRRARWHRPVGWAVFALAVPAYLGAMFLYY